jgi:hypothetical protein
MNETADRKIDHVVLLFGFDIELDRPFAAAVSQPTAHSAMCTEALFSYKLLSR